MFTSDPAAMWGRLTKESYEEIIICSINRVP